jgi:hypothetical protein
MSDTITTVNTPRLIELARWLTEQERKRRQGLDSEWNQSVWVRTAREDGDRNIQVIEGEQSVLVQGWSCGTAACAAGHISLEDGGMPAFFWNGDVQPVPPPLSQHSWYGDIWDAVADTLSDSQMLFGGEAEAIDAHARRALGLDSDQAGRLFEGENTWGTMVYLISQFTGIPRDELVSLVGGDTLPDDPDGEDDDSCDCGECTPEW